MQETQEAWVQSRGWEDLLEKGMATHSSILSWRIPWTEEPGGLQSIGLQRVGLDWSDWAHRHSVFYILFKWHLVLFIEVLISCFSFRHDHFLHLNPLALLCWSMHILSNRFSLAKNEKVACKGYPVKVLLVFLGLPLFVKPSFRMQSWFCFTLWVSCTVPFLLALAEEMPCPSELCFQPTLQGEDTTVVMTRRDSGISDHTFGPDSHGVH